MISVAEESGRLDQELVRIANVTEGDLDRQLKTAVAFAEPLHAVFYRRLHRDDFYRHGYPDFLPAGLHQITHVPQLTYENSRLLTNSQTQPHATGRAASP